MSMLPEQRRVVMKFGHEPATGIDTSDGILIQREKTSMVNRKREILSVKARIRLKKLAIFWPVKVSQIICAIYILIMTFSPSVGVLNTSTGNIIDHNSEENTENGVIMINGAERPVVADGTFQLVCLAISRASAFSLYPVMVLVFLTKCKATMSFFSKTPLSMYTIQDSHELHSYCGKYIAVDVWIHTIFHILRWIDQDNLCLLCTHRTGLSGLIVVVATPLICFPMMYAKESIPFEIRKGLHYLFYVFAIVMCFHVPTSALPNGGFIAYVMGFCICLYTLDAAYVFLFMSEKIETTTFHVLPTGVQMTMNVSERFQKQGESGGFAYVCLPWVDRSQWHAFSLFENPQAPTQRQVFMLNVGNWTKSVHAALQRDCARPVWIQGPFASPYSNAEAYDNQILVATGIGITPALSVIRSQKDSRRINLVWAVRDSAMLEFFMEHMYLDHDGWNLIFYTGKKPLNPALEEMNTNVRVHKGRPDFKRVIPNIIYGIESGVGKPETYTPSEIANVKRLLIERMEELDELDMTNREKLIELKTFASRQGFLFTELINDMEQEAHRSRSVYFQDGRQVSDGRSKEAFGLKTSDNSGGKQGVSRTESAMLQGIRDFGQMTDHRRTNGLNGLTRSNSSHSLTSKHARRRVRRLKRHLSDDMSDKSKASVLTSAFDPIGDHDTAQQYVRLLDRKVVLSTWGMLYCGGSKSVTKELKRISVEYNVNLNVESFAW